MVRGSRRQLTRLGIAGLVLAGTYCNLVVGGHAGASSVGRSLQFQRIAAGDRYGTAELLAEAAFPQGAPDAIIATGDDFPDALAAEYLAGREGAPILLVTPHLPLPSPTLAALRSLRTRQVTVLGLDGALGDDVEAAIAHTLSTAPGGAPIAVTRIGGQDRYDTMNLIDESPSAAAVGLVNGERTAILASGATFPDALAAGPLAYARGLPIILTDPTQLSVPAAETLLDLDIAQVLIVGGPLALSPSVESTVNQLGVTTLARLGGSDRSDTARLLGDYAIAHLGFSAQGFDVASGDPWLGGADALALGPLAAQPTPRSIQLLDAADDVGPGALQFVRDNSASLLPDTQDIVGGGPEAAPDAIVGLIAQSFTAGTGSTVLPQLVGASIQVPTSPPVPPHGAGTVVRFLFDTDLTNAVLSATNFFVYEAAAPDAPMSGGRAVLDPTDPDAVLVYFSTLTSPAAVGDLTLATVKPDAVALGGVGNPDGAAAIANARGVAAPAGLISAPDAASVAGYRIAATPDHSAMDVTFYGPVIDRTLGPDTDGFSIVFTDQTGSLEELQCLAPGSDGTAPSGGAVPGGNGTDVITIVCPDDPSTPSAVVTPRQVARIVIQPGTLSTPPPGGRVAYFLQAAGSPHLPSRAPDVMSATLIPGLGGSTPDRVDIGFDKPVVIDDGSRFLVVRADGQPSPAALGAVTDPGDPRAVEIDFPPNTDAGAVGVQVLSGAVALPGQPALANADDELDVTNPATASSTPGFTAGPQLVSVVLVLQQGGAAVKLTFSQPLGGPSLPTLNALHGYDHNGTELTCSAFDPADEPFPDVVAPATVGCISWSMGPTSHGPHAPATSAATLVMVTLDRGMVANAVGQHNPEQAVATNVAP